LAALATSSDSFAQDGPGQSAFARGSEYRSQVLTRSTAATQKRNNLVGEVVTRPTVVQAPAGTTVIAGTTSINPGAIAAAGPGATAAQLDVRCPLSGGRVLMHGNRILNPGEIVAVGENVTAAQVITRCDNHSNGITVIDQTRFDNLGRIRATR